VAQTAKGQRVQRIVNPDPTLRHIIGRVDRALRSQLNDQLADVDLTGPGYTTLFVLRRIPNLSNAELARHVGVSPQAINQIVLALVERDLLARRTSKNHSGILEMRLTAKGKRLIERCEREAEAIESAMLGAFTDAERRTFERLLRKAADGLGVGV
jgi:DNA-binding MarR family transcriptional regulator